MEEFIYILIGVIWIAASIYKATQKGKKPGAQKKPGDQQVQEESRPSQARSILEQLLSGQEISIPEPASREIYDEYDQIETVEEEKPVRSFQSEYAEYGFKGLEHVSGEGVTSLGQIKFVDEMKDTLKKERGQNKVNLRKAIIYSAILERPYS